MHPAADRAAPSLHRAPEEPLLGQSDEELRLADPLWMNLLVASGIPLLKHLDIAAYQRRADEWAEDLGRRLPRMEANFHKAPQDWKNDIHFFRLGALCWYVDQRLGIRYREDQNDLKRVLYTDPADLFLHGVMDSRTGTCGNMSALHVAIGWRLNWPVSLATVGTHFICRYDDGKVTHNIEATKTGGGGFHSHPDDYYLKEHRLTARAVRCGSDLRRHARANCWACSSACAGGTTTTSGTWSRRNATTSGPGRSSHRTGTCSTG